MSLISKFSLTNERPGAFDGIVAARYQFAAQYAAGKDILDIGCGLGDGAAWLAQHGAKSVLGVDYSPTAIREAVKQFELPNLKFQVGDALSLDSLSREFDLITAFELIEHLPPETQDRFVGQVKERLNPRGVFILSTPNKLISSPNRAKPLNPYHTKEFTPEELASLLERHFSETELWKINCVNREFTSKDRAAKQRLGGHLASLLSRYKIVNEVLEFIPRKVRWKCSGRDSLPTLEAHDFEFKRCDAGRCEDLLAICK